MDIPNKVIAFGPQDFADWVKHHMTAESSLEFCCSSDNIEEIEALVSENSPRVVFVDLDSFGRKASLMAGVLIQKGFRYCTVVIVFSHPNADLIPLARIAQRRSWSLVGRKLVEHQGFQKVMSGVLTESGLRDLIVSEVITNLHEDSLNTENQTLNDDEDDSSEIAA